MHSPPSKFHWISHTPPLVLHSTLTSLNYFSNWHLPPFLFNVVCPVKKHSHIIDINTYIIWDKKCLSPKSPSNFSFLSSMLSLLFPFVSKSENQFSCLTVFFSDEITPSNTSPQTQLDWFHIQQNHLQCFFWIPKPGKTQFHSQR